MQTITSRGKILQIKLSGLPASNAAQNPQENSLLLVQFIHRPIMVPTGKRSRGLSTEAFTAVHQLSVQVCPHRPCVSIANLTA